MRNLLIPLLLSAFLYSCNNQPSASQLKHQQQLRDDSIKRETINEINRNNAILEAAQKRNADRQTMLQMAAQLDANLQVEQSRMRDIQSFQLLRTSSEKETQVRNQANHISNIKLQLTNLRLQLNNLEKNKPYTIPQ